MACLQYGLLVMKDEKGQSHRDEAAPWLMIGIWMYPIGYLVLISDWLVCPLCWSGR